MPRSRPSTSPWAFPREAGTWCWSSSSPASISTDSSASCCTPRWSAPGETRAPPPGCSASPGAGSTRAWTAWPRRRKATARTEGSLAGEPDQLVLPSLEQPLRAWARGGDHQLARVLSRFHQHDPHRIPRGGAGHAVHPLDEGGSGAIAQLVEPGPVEVGGSGEAVEVGVGQHVPSVVLVDDGEGRAGHVLVP